MATGSRQPGGVQEVGWQLAAGSPVVCRRWGGNWQQAARWCAGGGVATGSRQPGGVQEVGWQLAAGSPVVCRRWGGNWQQAARWCAGGGVATGSRLCCIIK